MRSKVPHTKLFWWAAVVFMVIYVGKIWVDDKQAKEPAPSPIIDVPVSPGLPNDATRLYQLPNSMVCWQHPNHKSGGQLCAPEISDARWQD